MILSLERRMIMYSYDELLLEEIEVIYKKLSFNCVCDGDSKTIKLEPMFNTNRIKKDGTYDM